MFFLSSKHFLFGRSNRQFWIHARNLLWILFVFILFSETSQAANPLEMFLMPGELIEAHSAFEEDCDNCHQKLKKDEQNHLCLSCHDHSNIANDVKQKKGYHGRSKEVSGRQCKECHTDHEGRQHDIINFNSDTFVHTNTDFPLLGNHQVTACSACHMTNGEFRIKIFECITCHKEEDVHRGSLGESCTTCHSESNWKEQKFNHNNETEFQLSGAHTEVHCKACHVTTEYQDTPKACYGCHSINDNHMGRFGNKCDSCHKENSWDDHTFDHNKDTKFSLKGKHRSLLCNACHTEPINNTNKPRSQCSDCHLSEDVHKGSNGIECQVCHNIDEWGKVDFEHNEDTDFPLSGNHKSLSCESCHQENTRNTTLGKSCFDCHETDDIHSATLGRQCHTCHNDEQWREDVLFNHDLSVFPLIGQHGTIACNECHIDKKFIHTESACFECHTQDDVHEQSLGNDCHQCHNPNAWSLWLFEHNTQTEFSLNGAHENLACVSCHINPQSEVVIRSECNFCHQREDVHQGRFGNRCDRCHSEDNFQNINLSNY